MERNVHFLPTVINKPAESYFDKNQTHKSLQLKINMETLQVMHDKKGTVKTVVNSSDHTLIRITNPEDIRLLFKDVQSLAEKTQDQVTELGFVDDITTGTVIEISHDGHVSAFGSVAKEIETQSNPEESKTGRTIGEEGSQH